MTNISSINGNPIVLGASGLSDGSITDAKLVQTGGVLSEVSHLKNANKVELGGSEYLNANYVIGLLDTTVGGTGSINTAFTNRVATNNTVQYSRSIMLSVKSGYRYAIALINSDGNVTASKTVTSSQTYTVPASRLRS